MSRGTTFVPTQINNALTLHFFNGSSPVIRYCLTRSRKQLLGDLLRLQILKESYSRWIPLSYSLHHILFPFKAFRRYSHFT